MIRKNIVTIFVEWQTGHYYFNSISPVALMKIKICITNPSWKIKTYNIRSNSFERNRAFVVKYFLRMKMKIFIKKKKEKKRNYRTLHNIYSNAISSLTRVFEVSSLSETTATLETQFLLELGTKLSAEFSLKFNKSVKRPWIDQQPPDLAFSSGMFARQFYTSSRDYSLLFEISWIHESGNAKLTINRRLKRWKEHRWLRGRRASRRLL